MTDAPPVPDFAIDQTWYLWNGLVWQPYEIRALVDDTTIAWRTSHRATPGFDYSTISLTLLTTYWQLGQLQATQPTHAWSQRDRPEERR